MTEQHEPNSGTVCCSGLNVSGCDPNSQMFYVGIHDPQTCAANKKGVPSVIAVETP